MTRLLITGPLGHIGSRLIHSLRPGEFERVLLADNLLTQRYCSLFNLPAGVPFRFVEFDVCKGDAEALCRQADVVVHLAAITNAAASFENQEQVERVNFEGTQRVARACAAAGARLIFLSTTSVYGVSEGVVDEDCLPEMLKPQSPYADSKLRGERMLAALAQERGLKFVACRFGTIYGTSIGMRFHTAINKFIWQACVGEPLTVWRTALDQRRPYLELGDAVRAIRFILEKDVFDGRVYNVLTDNLTVRQIVGLIMKDVPDVEVRLVDAAIMNQLSYTVDNARFRALGFEFKGDIESAIAQEIAPLRRIRSVGVPARPIVRRSKGGAGESRS